MVRVFLLFSLILGDAAFAGERYEFYNGVRALGMGGASIAVVNDETALLSNPAALGKLRDYFITIADPEVQVASTTESVAGLDLLKMTNPQDALSKALKHPDTHLNERAQIFPSIVVPNFGFGFFGKYEINSQLNSTTNKFQYDYTNDYAMVLGFSLRLFDGIIKIGANARVDDRTQALRSDLDPTSTDLTLSSIGAGEGVGVGSDTGILITAPITWLPTLSAVYRDVGRTTYDLRPGIFSSLSARPDSTPSTLDVAAAIFPITGKRARMSWTAEYQDVMNAYKETDPMRRIHAGAEFNFADALFIRGGMNQRYWTGGLELDIVNYQFQAASYGEDIGDSTTHKEDRRYVLKFSFRF